MKTKAYQNVAVQRCIHCPPKCIQLTFIYASQMHIYHCLSVRSFPPPLIAPSNQIDPKNLSMYLSFHV